MADSDQIDLVHQAIAAPTWGNIEWKDAAYQRVLDDPALQGFTPLGIRLLLREFVVNGNRLTGRHETRTEYLDENPDDPYWYRAIIPVPQFPKGLFVEVRMLDDDVNEPWVQIVNAHRQQ